MVNDASYFHLVNRRLAAVQFQLLTASNKEITDTAAKQHACMDSALLQLYFASINYLNELLDHYQRPLLCSGTINLEEILIDAKNQFHHMYEVDEIKRWFNTKDSSLALLAKLPTLLMIRTTVEPMKRHGVVKEVAAEVNIIAVASAASEETLFSASVIRGILNHLQQLIDRQRANQSEY